MKPVRLLLAVALALIGVLMLVGGAAPPAVAGPHDLEVVVNTAATTFSLDGPGIIAAGTVCTVVRVVNVIDVVGNDGPHGLTPAESSHYEATVKCNAVPLGDGNGESVVGYFQIPWASVSSVFTLGISKITTP